MKLEEEIKQSKFESEYQKVMLNVMVTNNWILGKQMKFLKQYDLTPPQYNVLRILRGGRAKAMMLSDISERMLDKMSNATRLVEKLKQKGFVDRKLCETNRRQVDISITDEGMALLEEIDEPLRCMFKEFEGISSEEAKTINEILDKWRN